MRSVEVGRFHGAWSLVSANLWFRSKAPADSPRIATTGKSTSLRGFQSAPEPESARTAATPPSGPACRLHGSAETFGRSPNGAFRITGPIPKTRPLIVARPVRSRRAWSLSIVLPRVGSGGWRYVQQMRSMLAQIPDQTRARAWAHWLSQSSSALIDWPYVRSDHFRPRGNGRARLHSRDADDRLACGQSRRERHVHRGHCP